MKPQGILLVFLLMMGMQFTPAPAFAGPRSCNKKFCKKVLLPGHSKPMKCSKARKAKNTFF
ncbi:MAG: hypothetical protein RL222_109 [Bacteroidota bacterium]|jgi:hypothetical protein